MILAAQNRLHDTARAMDQQDPPEFILDVFADPRSVRDVVKGQQRPLHSLSSSRYPIPHPPAIPESSSTTPLPACVAYTSSSFLGYCVSPECR
ncbi:hypothetical protein AUP68_13133 [Ilyonectria robusta]